MERRKIVDPEELGCFSRYDSCDECPCISQCPVKIEVDKETGLRYITIPSHLSPRDINCP